MSRVTFGAQVMATPDERASQNYTQSDVTIMELQNLTDPDGKHWNWTTYLNAVFEQTDVIVDPIKDTALIEDMAYFKGFPLVLSKISRGITGKTLFPNERIVSGSIRVTRRKDILS